MSAQDETIVWSASNATQVRWYNEAKAIVRNHLIIVLDSMRVACESHEVIMEHLSQDEAQVSDLKLRRQRIGSIFREAAALLDHNEQLRSIIISVSETTGHMSEERARLLESRDQFQADARQLWRFALGEVETIDFNLAGAEQLVASTKERRNFSECYLKELGKDFLMVQEDLKMMCHNPIIVTTPVTTSNDAVDNVAPTDSAGHHATSEDNTNVDPFIEYLRFGITTTSLINDPEAETDLMYRVDLTLGTTNPENDEVHICEHILMDQVFPAHVNDPTHVTDPAFPFVPLCMVIHPDWSTYSTERKAFYNQVWKILCQREHLKTCSPTIAVEELD